MLRRLGLQPGDLEGEAVDLWPENVRVVNVFAALQTQWAIGGTGVVIGLRYEAVQSTLDLLGIKKGRRAVFRDLQVMEAEALREIQENRSDHG